MRTDSGSTTSVWMTESSEVKPIALQRDERADVCVIGAGIAGLSTAYHLTKAGKSVVVIDDGPIGGGETGRTTAHLASALDDRYFELERIHGTDTTQLAADSHSTAIELIQTIVNEESIDCDFETLDGYLFVPPNRSTRILKKELEAAHRAGLADVEMVDRAPIESFNTGPCLRFPNQAQFHPLKYLDGLARAITENGGRIFSKTRANEVRGGNPAEVKTDNGFTITAPAVVVATNSPFVDRVTIHTKQHAYRTYAIGAKIPEGSVARGLYWDTLDPYHYIRVYGDILIVGGEDHKTGQEHDSTKRFRSLERWARKRFPIERVSYRWSGQIMETLDGLAYIGQDPGGLENVYVVTGDSGMGMTHGTIAGTLLTDLILVRPNAWAQIYDPSRKSVRALKKWVVENLNMAAQFKDWVTGGDVQTARDVPTGEGAVIRDGLKKTAVYRDESGMTHSMSAVCPHLGCIVNWNSGEKTWDCPCHGSRFDKEGKVVNGPAVTDLVSHSRTRKVA